MPHDMMPLITPFYAGAMSLFLIILSWRIVNLRNLQKGKMNEEDHSAMAAATRAQGNLVEYLPTALLLLFFVEILEFRSEIVHGLGLLLIIARIMHIKGLNDPSGKSTLRKLGTRLTWVMMGAASLLAILGSFKIVF